MKLIDAESRQTLEDYAAKVPDSELRDWIGLQTVAAGMKVIEFLGEKVGFDEAPLEIIYKCSLIVSHLGIVLGREKSGQPPDELHEYFNSSDTREKFVLVVKELYQMCKKEKWL